MPRDWTAQPSTAYALKGNILYPGTSTQAGLVETAAEDALEADLGLGSTDLAGVLTVDYDLNA